MRRTGWIYIPHFNPRSHEGSDLDGYSQTTETNDFNPRSHEGSDRQLIFAFPVIKISIHAPTRGATQTGNIFTAVEPDFNPRSHEGSDTGVTIWHTDDVDFNPRSHEGSDPARPW